MNINELLPIRKSDPNKFWGEISSCLMEEYYGEEFATALRDVATQAFITFAEKCEKGDKLPYHWGYWPEVPNSHFRWFIQMTAQHENEIQAPMPIITGILAIPGDSYYTLHIHNDGTGVNEVDIFCPHFIERYASRSYRLDTDIELPKEWRYKKQPKTFERFNEKEFLGLFNFVGKFFGRNKMNRLTNIRKALSETERDKGSTDFTCLWMDGVSYCTPLCNEKVWLHKTFVPYFRDETLADKTELEDDQLRAIAPLFEQLFTDAHQKHSHQYPPMVNKDTYLKEIMGVGVFFKTMTPKIVQTQETVREKLLYFKDMGYIVLEDKMPSVTGEDHLKASSSLEELLEKETRDEEDIRIFGATAKCIWASHYQRLREFEAWYEESGRLAVLSEEPIFLMRRLMRGRYICKNVIAETGLLNKCCEVASKLFDNNLSNNK